jgi:hypothetical protein
MPSTTKCLTLRLGLFITLAAFAPTVAAQCVQCVDSGGAFSCGPSKNGGCLCAPVGADRGDCVLTTPCRAADGKQPATDCGGGGSTRSTGIRIEPDIIRSIGEVHPRFATMLASINKTGGLKKWMQVYQLAAPLNSSDVENWLKPEDDKEVLTFFKKYKKRYVRDAAPVVYEFTVEAIDETHSIIHGKVVSAFAGEPVDSVLTIELNDGKVMHWEVR